MAQRLTRRAILFVTMVTNCLAVALLSMAIGTHSWVSSECNNSITADGTGSVKFGLFDGYSELSIKTTIKKHYQLVCLESFCMYSSFETKYDRQESLRRILNTSETMKEESLASKKITFENRFHRFEQNGRDFFRHARERGGVFDFLSSKDSQMNKESIANSETALMKEGFIVTTIVALCLSLFFCVTGAVFGVVNSATNPYQLITGIPGLYFWNLCAAVFELIALVCGGVLYGEQLDKNMLLEDAEDGWTNEGLGHLGYSYWLILITLVLHLVNSLLVFLATRHKVPQEQYHEPISTSADTLLY